MKPLKALTKEIENRFYHGIRQVYSLEHFKIKSWNKRQIQTEYFESEQHVYSRNHAIN